MFDFTYELEQLRTEGVSPKLLERIIKKHQPRAEVMKRLYDRYRVKAEGLPILNRTLDDPMKVNNRVNNDFFSEIIDTKVGFFAGTPVTYKAEQPGADEYIQELSKRNRLADVDAETTKYAAICGYAARLLYVDLAGNERVVNCKPWQCILIGENGIDEPEYAIRYYTVEAEKGEEIRVEFYEAGKLTIFKGEDTSKLVQDAVIPQVYDHCQMWGYENNEELMGDAEKVLALIDAYDRTMSDVNSEIEAFRTAYLAFFGVEPPEEGEEQSFMTAGVFYFANDRETKQSAQFITKQMNDQAVENHLERLHENIYRFAKSPDMGEDTFGNQTSGIAAKYRMLALENKTAVWERKFKSASIRMFEILSTSSQKKGGELDPYAIEMKFTRNFPQDLMNEADIQTKLKGSVSEETRLSVFSVVNDVQEELDRMEKERAAYSLEDEDETENKLNGGVPNDGQVGQVRPGTE